MPHEETQPISGSARDTDSADQQGEGREDNYDKAHEMAIAEDIPRTEAARVRADPSYPFSSGGSEFMRPIGLPTTSYVEQGAREISEHYDKIADEEGAKQAAVYDKLHETGAGDPRQNPQLAEVMASAEAPYAELIKNMIEQSDLEDKEEIIRLLTEEKDQLVQEAKDNYLVEQAHEREARQAEHQRYVIARRKTLGMILGSAEHSRDFAQALVMHIKTPFSWLNRELPPSLEQAIRQHPEPMTAIEPIWSPPEQPDTRAIYGEGTGEKITQAHAEQIRQAAYAVLGAEAPVAEEFDFKIPKEVRDIIAPLKATDQSFVFERYATVKETPTKIPGLTIREYRRRMPNDFAAIYEDGMFVHEKNKLADDEVGEIQLALVNQPPAQSLAEQYQEYLERLKMLVARKAELGDTRAA